MIRLVFAVIVLIGISLIVIGIYTLLSGQINLIRYSLQGPVARLLGFFLIAAGIMWFPLALRVLVGMTMSLGR